MFAVSVASEPRAINNSWPLANFHFTWPNIEPLEQRLRQKASHLKLIQQLVKGRPFTKIKIRHVHALMISVASVLNKE